MVLYCLVQKQIQCNTFIFSYKCGAGRRFVDPVTKQPYYIRTMECQWNQSWTPTSSLDTCVWYQCVNPPQVGSIVEWSTFWEKNCQLEFCAILFKDGNSHALTKVKTNLAYFGARKKNKFQILLWVIVICKFSKEILIV